MTDAGFALIVERVDQLSSRPQWIFVTGVHSGDPIMIGDNAYLRNDNEDPMPTTIESIEIHSPPGKTTVVLAVDNQQVVKPGTVVTNRPQ